MSQKKSTFICPYCFEEHKLLEVQFRCANKRCVDVDDMEITKYENGNINAPKKGKKCFDIPMTRKNTLPNSAECPECKQKTYKMVCPSCHNPLPESTLTGRNMIISIVGSRDTGKSHFIGVIINELINRISVKFGGAMEAFDDTMKRYEDNFGRRLYVDLQKLDLTQSSELNVNNGAYRPLIFTLNFKSKIILKDVVDSFTFVFFDTAGEDLNDLDTMNTVNKYICKSAGIIFLLDPTKIPAVANQLDDKTIAQASSVDMRLATGSDDIMGRISKLIRHDKNLKQTELIKMPVAAVFSKFDVIESIVRSGNPGSIILNPSPHCSARAFDLSDWHNVNTEIQSLLRGWNADSFMMQLEVNYKTYSYFTVSALGLNNNPREDSGIKTPAPHRIEDPLLWILKENGVIRSKTTSFNLREFIIACRSNFNRIANLINLSIARNVFISIVILLIFILTRDEIIPLTQNAGNYFLELKEAWTKENQIPSSDANNTVVTSEHENNDSDVDISEASGEVEDRSTDEIANEYIPQQTVESTIMPAPTFVPTPMPTFEPTTEPMPEILEPAVNVDDFILPYSNSKELTDIDLRNLTKDELRLARNEMYARYGRVFRDELLQEYFDSKSWYSNLQKLPLGTEPILTDLELANITLIQEYEAR